MKKTKCMLQSKETDQFDTRCLTHVVVVVSGFPWEKKNRMDLLVKSNTLRSKSCKKRKDVETEDNNIHGLQKKLKLM